MTDTVWISPLTASAQEWLSLLQNHLAALENRYWVLRKGDSYGFKPITENDSASAADCVGILPALPVRALGNPSFQRCYGVTANYMAGAMAHGIASVDMVIALGRAGLLASFGTGGLSLPQVEKAIIAVQQALPDGPYAFNFLSNPYSASYEQQLVDLYLRYGVTVVEASAFIEPSAALVYYRVQGLAETENGEIVARNRIIAKVSRQEVAQKFLSPASEKTLNQLLTANKITQQQANWARQISLADDITVEADSGGHTDNRPLVSQLPALIAVRDRVCAEHAYRQIVRIGAAGGVGTPQSVLAAFSMGADYVVTGSVNQACIEAGTSKEVKALLAKAKMADVTMAPAADMFEEGVRVQVLKGGSLFPMQSQKLYELYRTYPSIDAIPELDRQKLEKSAFKKKIEEVWNETVEFFTERDPSMLERAQRDPKKKMSLIFRWYLGKSSFWAITGNPEQMINAQIWCGQAMGAFNEWSQGSSLQMPENRRVVAVADVLLNGAALAARSFYLHSLGLQIPGNLIKAAVLNCNQDSAQILTRHSVTN